MKFKIDENLPAEIAQDLRVLGHDASTVAEEGITGIDDEGLVSRVREESRVFVTMDKGIADIQAYPPEQFAGLILFRPEEVGRGAVLSFVRSRLTQLLMMHLRGRLVVVGTTGVRIKYVGR